MKQKTSYDALILEGGSLRCSFTAGVLDTFAAIGFRPFKSYYAVSAGSMALTSFLSGQRRHFVDLALRLVEDSKFISFTAAFSEEGLMNLSRLAQVVKDESPIDWNAANQFIEGKKVHIVTTDFETGEAHYLSPQRENWIRSVLASSSLPLVTRGRLKLRNRWMFDGGYSDPIPLKKAIEDGCSNILVIRTRPRSVRVEQDTLDLIVSYIYRDNQALARLFQTWHTRYNQVVDLLEKEKELNQSWNEIAPLHELKSDGYRISKEDVLDDYHHGLERALEWIDQNLEKQYNQDKT